MIEATSYATSSSLKELQTELAQLHEQSKKAQKEHDKEKIEDRIKIVSAAILRILNPVRVGTCSPASIVNAKLQEEHDTTHSMHHPIKIHGGAYGRVIAHD